MKKEMNNKGFSLVELIIVVAIMAVLIGVLAPAYLQYVEKSKKTKDCGTIGSVMDAIEIVAADPAVTWTAGTGYTFTINTGTTAATYGGFATEIGAIVPANKTVLGSSWAAVSFEATKGNNGVVTFTNLSGLDAATPANAAAEIQKISPALEARFQ
jgi:prepilin-type N-terminal cleavage/methylation domain-containing protein